MPSMIKELKKENRSLALKIRYYEETIKMQNKELTSLKTENFILKNQVENNDMHQKISELELIKHFCGMQANIIETLSK